MNDNTNLASELRPCPFCGDDATLVKDKNPDGQCSYKIAYVKCNSCGCRSAAFIVDGYYGAKATVRDAIKSWNRRPVVMDESRNKYRDFTDDMRTLCEAFCESGFTEEQAIKLTGNVMSVSFSLQTLNQKPRRVTTTEERRRMLNEVIKKQKEKEEQKHDL